MASILAVDDSASTLQVIASTLEGAGYDVVEAADGNEALSLAEGQAVDLVVTDAQLPNMDGITLLRRLRELPSYQSTPAVMLTTETSPEEIEEGNAVGVVEYIVKPFNPDSLLTTVEQVIT